MSDIKVDSKIILNLPKDYVELTKEQAEELYCALKKVLNHNDWYNVPYYPSYLRWASGGYYGKYNTIVDADPIDNNIQIDSTIQTITIK